MSENYLIIGDDEYIKEAEERKLKDKFLSSGEVDLNYSVCGSGDIAKAMDSLETMPFLADKRVVVIKDAQDLPEKDLETLLSYLDKPSKSSVLILSAGSSFKKDKYYRKLSGSLKEIKADKPDEATIKKWIHSFFKKQNIDISPQAVDLIVELKGTDTPSVKTELEKLAAFSAGGKIEIGHVEEIVGRSVTESVFKLVDAINAKDAKWVFRVLGDLYDQKKQPPEIIGYLSWYIRIMQKIALLSGRGASSQEVSMELGYSPAYARRLQTQAKKYPVKRINSWTHLLFEADRDIKTGRRQADLAMEMLLVSLLKS